MTGRMQGRRDCRLTPCAPTADVDLAVMDDFYKYFKSDIMAGMNWVCGCEGDCGHLACNGGGAPITEP